MSKNNLNDLVNQGVKRIVRRFLEILEKTKSKYNKQVILGAFVYLLDEQDIVPDDTPNIGLLDDLMLFLEIYKNFEVDDEIKELFDYTEFYDLYNLVDKNKGLIFSPIISDIAKIQEIGNKNLSDIQEITRLVKFKYNINL